jgi:hypothetical protein
MSRQFNDVDSIDSSIDGEIEQLLARNGIGKDKGGKASPTKRQEVEELMAGIPSLHSRLHSFLY